MAEFIEVRSKATGRIRRVPAHFQDHPNLFAPFELTDAGEVQAAGAGMPEESWTVAQMRAWAEDAEHPVDLTGLTGKADIYQAVSAAAAGKGQ